MYLFWIMVFSGCMPRSSIAGSLVTLILVFWGTSILFSIVAAPIYIPIKSSVFSVPSPERVISTVFLKRLQYRYIRLLFQFAAFFSSLGWKDCSPAPCIIDLYFFFLFHSSETWLVEGRICLRMFVSLFQAFFSSSQLPFTFPYCIGTT